MDDYNELANSLLNSLNKSTVEFQSQNFIQAFSHCGDSLKRFSAKMIVCKRVVNEPNNLELYANLVKLIDDEDFDEMILDELGVICTSLLNKTNASKSVKEALRNLGVFLGLLTIVRNKPINADMFNFRQMLEESFQSGDNVRLTLAVVFVTHVFKYCQHSLIFRRTCTWVSQIIKVLEDIHRKTENKLQISLEIERFQEGLNETADEKLSGQEENELMDDGLLLVDGNTASVDQIDVAYPTHHLQPTFSEQIYPQHGVYWQQQASQFEHQPGSFYSPQQFVPQHMSVPESSQPVYHYQGHPVYHYQGHLVPMMELRHVGVQRVSPNHHVQPQQMYGHQPTTRSSQVHNEDDHIVTFILNHLSFEDAPIFTIFPSAKDRVTNELLPILSRLEDVFIRRITETLSMTCNAFLLRDLAFCNDENQLRVSYHKAIRCYMLALLHPRCYIGTIRNNLQSLLRTLFVSIIRGESIGHKDANEGDHFVVNSAEVFIEKNQSLISDCLCAIIDRRAMKWADQSATRTINERKSTMLGHKPRELKYFVREPCNSDQINDALPPLLRRQVGKLCQEHFRIYERFEEFSDMFRDSMSRYGLQCNKQLDSSGGVEENQPVERTELKQERPSSFEARPEPIPLPSPIVEEDIDDSDSLSQFMHFKEIKDTDGLRDYIESLYRENPSDYPKFFFEYVRLVTRPRFLERLMGYEEISRKEAHGYLVLLVLPVMRLMYKFAEQRELMHIGDSFGMALLNFFGKLTRNYPVVFAEYHIVFSETIPDMLLNLRNMFMDCKPDDVELLPVTDNLQSLCNSPSMKVDLPIDIAELCSLSDDIKSIITSHMNDECETSFPDNVIPSFKFEDTNEEEDGQMYDRARVLHIVVYIAHLAIKDIRSKSLTIDRSNLTSNPGQAMLIKMVSEMDNGGRYIAISMMADQLRYPSTMTAYFICLLLNMFAIIDISEIREILTRVLIERFLTPKPYPWGLRVVLHELIYDSSFKFGSYEYVLCSSDIGGLIKRIEENVNE